MFAGLRSRLFLVPAVVLAVQVPTLLRDRSEIAAGWPLWRTTLIDLLPVLAGGLVLAATVAGLVAWLEARRITHA